MDVAEVSSCSKELIASRLSLVWRVCGMPDPPVGLLAKNCVTSVSGASYLQFIKPDLKTIYKNVCNRGCNLADGDRIVALLTSFGDAIGEHHLRCNDATVLRDLYSLHPDEASCFGSLLLAFKLADWFPTARSRPNSSVQAMALYLSESPELICNRSQTDRRRPPEEPILLTDALMAGDVRMIRMAVEARDRACRWNAERVATLCDDFSPLQQGKDRQQTPPFLAVDVAMLIVYCPEVAVEVLQHPTMFGRTSAPPSRHRSRDSDFITLREAVAFEPMLDAALAAGAGAKHLTASERRSATDDVLATPLYLALLSARFHLMRPFYLLDSALQLALFFTYVCWAFGAEGCGAAACVLALYVALSEVLQAVAELQPLLGDTSLQAHGSILFGADAKPSAFARQLDARLVAPIVRVVLASSRYDVLDWACVVLVLATVLREKPTVADATGSGILDSSSSWWQVGPRGEQDAEAVTALLLMFKLICNLRALEQFRGGRGSSSAGGGRPGW